MTIHFTSDIFYKLKESRNGITVLTRPESCAVVNIAFSHTVAVWFRPDAVAGIRFFIVRRCFKIANIAHQINEEITDREIRLIGEDGAQLGIMSASAAMDIAVERGLDLVKISPTAVPPVCRLMDYGKYRFEQSKREKEARRNQHVVEVKEIRMSPSIGDNDFNVKLRNGQKFLRDGDRLKVAVRFRGREMAHTSIGEELLRKFAEGCADIATVDKAPKLEGRHMSIFLSPKSSK